MNDSVRGLEYNSHSLPRTSNFTAPENDVEQPSFLAAGRMCHLPRYD